jgi:hypothetical protein
MVEANEAKATVHQALKARRVSSNMDLDVDASNHACHKATC